MRQKVLAMKKETKENVSGIGCLSGVLGFVIVLCGLAFLSFWTTVFGFVIAIAGFTAGMLFTPLWDEP